MHMSLHTLPELVIFLHTLPSILQQHPRVSNRLHTRLITVLIFILFSDRVAGLKLPLVPATFTEWDQSFSPARRSAKVKGHAHKSLCLHGSFREPIFIGLHGVPLRHGLGQVVITTQLATKFINSDGSLGGYDSGARAVMVPQPSMYLVVCADICDNIGGIFQQRRNISLQRGHIG